MPQALQVAQEATLFVSSNAFDVMRAKAFGFQVAWSYRSHALLDELGWQPDMIIPRLNHLLQVLSM